MAPSEPSRRLSSLYHATSTSKHHFTKPFPISDILIVASNAVPPPSYVPVKTINASSSNALSKIYVRHATSSSGMIVQKVSLIHPNLREVVPPGWNVVRSISKSTNMPGYSWNMSSIPGDLCINGEKTYLVYKRGFDKASFVTGLCIVDNEKSGLPTGYTALESTVGGRFLGNDNLSVCVRYRLSLCSYMGRGIVDTMGGQGEQLIFEDDIEAKEPPSTSTEATHGGEEEDYSDQESLVSTDELSVITDDIDGDDAQENVVQKNPKIDGPLFAASVCLYNCHGRSRKVAVEGIGKIASKALDASTRDLLALVAIDSAYAVNTPEAFDDILALLRILNSSNTIVLGNLTRLGNYLVLLSCAAEKPASLSDYESRPKLAGYGKRAVDIMNETIRSSLARMESASSRMTTGSAATPGVGRSKERASSRGAGNEGWVTAMTLEIIDESVDRVELTNNTQRSLQSISRHGMSENFWRDMVLYGRRIFGEDEDSVVVFSILCFLCKLISGNVRKMRKRGKVVQRDVMQKMMGLEFLYDLLRRGGGRFRSKKMGYVVRRIVVHSVLMNLSAGMDDGRVFKRLLKVITLLWGKYREHLKVEIAVLCEHCELLRVCARLVIFFLFFFYFFSLLRQHLLSFFLFFFYRCHALLLTPTSLHARCRHASSAPIGTPSSSRLLDGPANVRPRRNRTLV